MILPWLILIIEILLFFIIKPFTNDPDFFATVLIAINIPIVLFVFIRYMKEAFLLLLIGLFLRLFTMYWDIYANDIFLLPNSGEDSVGFYLAAVSISENLGFLRGEIYGGLYSKILGIVLYLGPESRILLQYINVLLGIFTIMLVYKIMTQLKVDLQYKKILLLVMVFFPSSIILSSILLREAFITFLITLSFAYFLQWIFKGDLKNAVLSITALIIGGLFHSGVIIIFIGYFFMFLFYRPQKKKFQTSRETVFVFSALLLSIVYLTSLEPEQIPFLAKYTHALETTENLYEITTDGRGGSSYLDTLVINNPIQLILYSPLKMFYFYISPLPMDWRGLKDIITFTADSMFYGVLFLYPVFNYRKLIKGDPVAISLFIMLLAATFTFGIALNNTGTAMRHRNKLFYLIILLFSISIQKRNNNKLESERKLDKRLSKKEIIKT